MGCISLSPKGIHREHLPTFIVIIENEKMLEQAFEEFLRLPYSICRCVYGRDSLD